MITAHAMCQDRASSFESRQGGREAEIGVAVQLDPSQRQFPGGGVGEICSGGWAIAEISSECRWNRRARLYLLHLSCRAP